MRTLHGDAAAVTVTFLSFIILRFFFYCFYHYRCLTVVDYRGVTELTTSGVCVCYHYNLLHIIMSVVVVYQEARLR